MHDTIQSMKIKNLHVIVWKEDRLFVAKILELEVASQGTTKQEALNNVKEALKLFLEDENTNSLRFPSIEDVTAQTLSIN